MNCPKCKSTNTKKYRQTGSRGPQGKKLIEYYRCLKCEKEWKVEYRG